ncbi:MAG: CBS domain-containing protein [Woeseia sp.]|nr:CBS domain-containing protein [Woeseia sp.]MBT8096020.1 CBS domain-containing protein [Woeseia sp.]NNE59522.1 CBS domain-containing protein [Woeseia sp.]NNL54367.1 CBS domain-containing protein [Woeseia sp.]
MKLVQHLLDVKGREVTTISPDATVLDAVRLMAEKSIGALVILDGEKLQGMVSERDYARKVILKGLASDDIPVSAIMRQDPAVASSGSTIQECMSMVTEGRVRHLPVVDDGKVTGIISIGDLVKAIIADQQAEIEQLGQYISG